MKLRDYSPGLYEGNKVLPSDILDDRLPPAGNVYFVKKTTDSDYSRFFNKFNYVNDVGQNSVQNTITAGIALLQDYDTLIIMPGNYDEAAKVTLGASNIKGVKILGYSTGMQWGEGGTCWRNVTSGTDILDIAYTQNLEIAGITFVVTSADEDAINFTGNSYAPHIHNCGFIGDVGGGAVMAYGINAGGSVCSDLYVHDCRFFRVKTSGIVMSNQRNVVSDCLFIIPASGKGTTLSGSAASGYNVIKNCDFLGANSGDIGIYTATSVIGNWMASNCRFAAVADAIQNAATADSDENVALCQQNDAGLGGVAGVDSEA